MSLANFDLNYCIENRIIDMQSIQQLVEMKKKQELLDRHPYKPWCGKDGKWYVYIPDENKKRILKKRTTKEGIEDVIVQFQKDALDNPTIEEVFSEWNDYRRDLNKIAKSSHTRFRQIFQRHFGEFGKTHIKDVTEEMIIDFLESQIPEHNLSSKAFSDLKSLTRGILKRARRRKMLSFNPEMALLGLDVSDREFKKRVKEDCTQVFYDNEMTAMVEYLKENYDIRNAGILLLFVSGMRIGELVALQHEDLDPELNTIKIRRTETRYQDGDSFVYFVKDYPKTAAGIREIVIPTSYQWLIRDLYTSSSNGGYVFSEHGVRIPTYKIRRREYSVCAKTGVKKKGPHKIRATYDTILLDSGTVDNRMVKDQMGHSDIRTSEVNYHRNRKTHDRKREIMDSIDEFK